MPSIDGRHSVHIRRLDLCIPFRTAVDALSFKEESIKKNRASVPAFIKP